MKPAIILSVLALSVPGLGAGTDFPAVFNSETDTNAVLISPHEALSKLKLPPGFKASIFAAEPDVQNPIGMAWDAKGRLWVAENYTYAERGRRFETRLRDRILIFEGAGSSKCCSSRKVFTDELQTLTSVEVGRGGVWALCPPQLLFIPDQDDDGIPDGAVEVVLDGFKVPNDNYHNFANGLRWGPDGWLYGRCGCSAPGELGRPNSSPAERVPLRGGIWRYHPERKTVEVVSHGTMNPWGHDWNEFGETFFVNTVSGHFWHTIPGAHFLTAHTLDPNPRAYELIEMHADHWHFDTAIGWSHSRDGIANDFGGGHAHAGGMFYLGDNWPDEYRRRFFTLNYFGRRANQEILEQTGSGYVAHHGKDCFLFGDTWFRGLDLSYGPDGSVFVLDWSDTGECHESTGVHRTSGRIYKISYGAPEVAQVDLTRLSAGELVELHLKKNEWYSREARIELARRKWKSAEADTIRDRLRNMFESQADPAIKLRALWSLNVMGAADNSFLRQQLHHKDEHVRIWAIRLLTDSWPIDTVMSQRPANSERQVAKPGLLKELTESARSDPSAAVRLALASTLQRLAVVDRVDLALALVDHAEDAKDHNLPLVIWYGLIAVADQRPEALADIGGRSRIPLVRKLIARRLGEDIEKNPVPLNQLLGAAASGSGELRGDVVAGLSEAMRGWSKARQPEEWPHFQASAKGAANQTLADRVRDLSALFGDGRALDEIKTIALDRKAELASRKTALETLIAKRPPQLREICETALKVKFLNSTAIKGLALFNDPEIARALLTNYHSFHPSERPPVIDMLCSRPVFARILLDEIAEMRVPRADLTPFHARQIASFNDAALTKRLNGVWGELRDSSAEKKQQIARWKAKLTSLDESKADKSHGRQVFEKTCGACHTLYGRGGQVGPDLTGSGRDNLDYVLENVVDPSALVNADFRMTIVAMKDGRTLNGIIAAKTERTISLKTMTETVSLEREQIEQMRESAMSLMPEGLLEALSESEARDLVAYVMNKTQMPR